MKNTLIISLFSILIGINNSFGQCDEYVKKSYDKFENLTEYNAYYSLIRGDQKLQLHFHTSSKNDRVIIDVKMYYKQNNAWKYADWVQTQNILYFAFSDGDVAKLYHFDLLNQVGMRYLNIWLYKKGYNEKTKKESAYLYKLKTTTVTDIRLRSIQDFDFVLTENEQKELKSIINCLGI